MAFHNTYNKKNIVEEYKKRFQQILEYTMPGSNIIDEDDEEPTDDNIGPNANDNMGMDTDASMGDDPNAMNGDMDMNPNTMDSDMSTPEGSEDLTSGFNPQGVNDPNTMGGDMGEYTAYAYIKINGEIVYTASAYFTVYNEWHTATIKDIEYKDGDVMVVGLYVKCTGSGSGAWGKIDDALLNSVNN